MNRKSVTLVELIISIAVVSIVILSFYSMDNFSRNQILNSERRAKVQNELSLVLEHMGKYVQSAEGNNLAVGNRAIQTQGTGFQVRVDLDTTPDPNSLNDDCWVRYSLAGNNLNTACVAAGGTCGNFSNATLCSRIIAGGFTSQIADNGTSVYVNLIGRFDPNQAASQRNPQVEIRTKLVCNSCSIN